MAPPQAEKGMKMDTILGANGAPNAIPAGALIKDASTATFQVDVLDASKQVPVIVDFWAPWCGPCKQLGPALEKAVTAAQGKVKLVKINVDENQELAGQMGVKSIPAVFGFSGGQPVDGFMGAIPDSEIASFIGKLTAGAPAGGGESDFDAQVKAALETAGQAVAAGEHQQAAQIFQMILQQLPDNLEALTGLASVHLVSGDLDTAKELLDALDDEALKDDNVVALAKAIKLAEQAAKLGDAGDLQQRIVADPADHQARLDLATLLNHQGDRLAAAEMLIASIKLDREWNEGAARVRLLEFFSAWGPADAASIKGRRLLSSVLFS